MDRPLPAGTHSALSVVRACLAAEAGQVVPWPRVPAGEQAAVVDVVIEQQVTWLVAAHASGLGLDGPALGRLHEAAASDVRAAMRVQTAAAILVGGLNDHGIRCLTYKGAALAVATTGDPAARGPGDVDIIVAPHDVPAAHAYLLEQGASFAPGYCPSPDSPLWPTARRVGCEMPYRWKGVDIDVHWRFDRLPQIADVAFDDLWSARALVVLGGREVPTLGAQDALLVTVAHGTKEHWRTWRWIVDLVRQARQVTDWAALIERGRVTGCEDALAVGLAMHDYLAPHAAPLVPGPRARRLAAWSWENACRGSAPFDGPVLASQVARMRWTWQTLPSRRAAGSLVMRQGITTLDMAELPLPRALAWGYPVVRPYLWARRLITGRYGPNA